MLPALRVKGLCTMRCEKRDGGAAEATFEDTTDLCDWNASDFAGQADSGWGGEEELVVFAAGEGLLQGRGRVNGKGGRVNLSGDAGFFANVGEIGGKAITEVDGGGGRSLVD